MGRLKKSVDIDPEDVAKLLNLKRFKHEVFPEGFSGAVRILVEEEIAGAVKHAAPNLNASLNNIGLVEIIEDHTLRDFPEMISTAGNLIIFHQAVKSFFDRGSNEAALFQRLLQRKSTVFIFPYKMEGTGVRLANHLTDFFEGLLRRFPKSEIARLVVHFLGIDEKYCNPNDLIILTDKELVASMTYLGVSTRLAARYVKIESVDAPYNIYSSILKFQNLERGWINLTKEISGRALSPNTSTRSESPGHALLARPRMFPKSDT